MKNYQLILLFAFLHALVSLGCRLYGIGDDLLLTLLTMLMVVLICLSKGTNAVYMSVTVILANIIGFTLGEGLAGAFFHISIPTIIVNPLSTFICTCVIGFLVDGFSHSWVSGFKSNIGLRWMLIAFVIIILLRMVLAILKSDLDYSRNLFVEIMLDYIFSCLAIVLVALHSIRMREKAKKSAEEASIAQFKYLNLKQQLNPHFLFNSLNTLDCLIQSDSKEQASEYTHKLAELYRYMLRNENMTIVSLRQEMEFSNMYMDLQKLRFGSAVELEVDISEQDLSKKVVTGAMQILIENAMKHNVVSRELPLKISIRSDGENIIVSNNKIPKLSPAPPGGLGHKYLQQLYEDIASKSITINEGTAVYTVSLPLILTST